MGNRLVSPASKTNGQEVNLEHQSEKFQKFADSIQKDYYDYIESNLKLQKKYPEILNQAANEFNILDGQLTDIIGKVYRIQREIADQRIN